MVGDAHWLPIEREAAFVEGLHEERAIARKHDDGRLAVLRGNKGAAKSRRDQPRAVARRRPRPGRAAVSGDELAEEDAGCLWLRPRDAQVDEVATVREKGRHDVDLLLSRVNDRYHCRRTA